jgi:outer membrane protein OmpA-like peptidoglycan-associated protein
MKRISIIGLMLILLSTPLIAQKKRNDLLTANKLFEIGRYYDALEYYERALERRGNNPEARLRYAEAAYYSRDYKLAEDLYYNAFNSDKSGNAKAQFMLGVVMKMNGKYADAKKEFESFLKSYKAPDAADWKRKTKLQIEGCDAAVELLKKPNKEAQVNHLDNNINSYYTEYAPIPIGLRQLMFSSMRANEDVVLDFDSKNKLFSKIFSSNKTDDKNVVDFENAQEFKWFNDNGSHNGDGAFSTDRRRFYFTRCEANELGVIECHIYVATKDNKKNSWNDVKKLGSEVNISGVNSTSPSVAVIKGGVEILYFITDRPNGVGGKDIWYVTIEKDGTIKQPTNCGRKVNTEMDEITPFYEAKSSTLYFSSNGHPGLGGFDIFASKGTAKKLADPINVGLPFNSSVDDMYYITDKNNDGYFVSNRPGTLALKSETCCDDIFSFTNPRAVQIGIEGLVVEKIEEELYFSNGGAVVLLSSIDGETQEEVQIEYDSVNNKRTYYFDVLPDKEYKLTASKDGFLTGYATFNTTGLEVSDTLYTDVQIVKVIANKTVIVKDIFYDFDKASLRPESKPGLDTLLAFMNDNPFLIVELGAHTDNKGSDEYNNVLSQSRAQTVVDYLRTNKIDSSRLIAKGYGESQPIVPNENPNGSDNPDNRQRNRRTELKIVGQIYGYNIDYESERSKYITPEALKKLRADSSIKARLQEQKDSILAEAQAALQEIENVRLEKERKKAEARERARGGSAVDDKKKKVKKIDGPCNQYDALIDKASGQQQNENFRDLWLKNPKADPSVISFECRKILPYMGPDGLQKKEKNKLIYFSWEYGISGDSVLAIEEAKRLFDEERAKIKDLIEPVEIPDSMKVDTIASSKKTTITDDGSLSQAKKDEPKVEPKKDAPKQDAPKPKVVRCKDYQPIKEAGKQKYKDGYALFIKDLPKGAKADAGSDCENYEPVKAKDGKTQLKTPEGKPMFFNVTMKEEDAANEPESTPVSTGPPCTDYAPVKGNDGLQIVKDGKAYYIKKGDGKAKPDESGDCKNYKPLKGKDGKSQMKNADGKLMYYKMEDGMSDTPQLINGKNPCDLIETYFDNKGAPVKIDGKQVYIGPGGCKAYSPVIDTATKKQKKAPDGRGLYF